MSCPYKLVCLDETPIPNRTCILTTVPSNQDCAKYDKMSKCKLLECDHTRQYCSKGGFTCRGIRATLPKHLLEMIRIE